MLRQPFLRSAFRQTGPTALSPINCSLFLRLPKNASLPRTAVRQHIAMRAYVRPRPAIPLSQLKPEVTIDASEATPEERLGSDSDRLAHKLERLMHEDPDGSKSRKLLYIFILISTPITFLWQFPMRALPPVPDPPQYRHLSNTPLTLETWLTSPVASLGLFSFRVRRGEYAEGLRQNFAYTPLNWMGVDRDGNKDNFRWWTFITHVFSHGGSFHWFGCLMGLRAVLPTIVPGFGVTRTLALCSAAAVGSAMIVCIAANLAHGNRIREGKGFTEQTTMLNVTDKLGHVYQKEVKMMLPAPELRQVYSPTVGSSGVIMSLFAITAIIRPAERFGILFIPFYIPVRALWGGLVVFDILGAMGKLPFGGIAHGGHLAGDVVGVLGYLLWLRRTPPGRLLSLVPQPRWWV